MIRQEALKAVSLADDPPAATAAARRRMLFVTLHFPPSRDIGAHACEQIARYFPRFGWEPVVLTRPRRFIEFFDPEHRRSFPGRIVEAAPLPHPLSLYRRLKRAADPGSGKSAGAASTKTRQGRLRRWVLSLLEMPDRYTGWLLPATIAGLRTIRRENIEHIVSSGPYWTNHLVGLLLARLTGRAWTAHYRDPWNQVPQSKPVSRLSAAIERWLERRVIARADSIVCVTDRHVRVLRDAFPSATPAKFVAIPNGYDGEEWDDLEPARSRKFVITYPGGFSLGTRSPRPLFEALRSLIDRGDVNPELLQVDLFGNCETAEGMPVAEMASAYGLGSVVTVGPSISRRETLRRIAGSNLLLLLAEGWDLQIPGKTYEFLRSGRPILALTGDGAVADLLQASGGATVAAPGDRDRIADGVRDAWMCWKRNVPGPAPEAELIESFDRRRLAGRYAALFGQRTGTIGPP